MNAGGRASADVAVERGTVCVSRVLSPVLKTCFGAGGREEQKGAEALRSSEARPLPRKGGAAPMPHQTPRGPCRARAAATPEDGPLRTVTFARAFRGDAEDGVGAKRLSSTGELFLPTTVLGDFPPQRTWPWWPPVSSELLPDRSADFLLPGTSPTGWRGEHGESLRQRAARTMEASRRPGCSPGRECRAPPRGGFVVLQSGPLLPGCGGNHVLARQGRTNQTHLFAT